MIFNHHHIRIPESLAEVRFNVHAYISKNVWMKLIKEALDLTYLDMTPAEDMTDANIKSLLLDHPKSLKKLRNFIVRGRHRGGDIALTEASIDNLASRCSSIKCIGDCSTWSLSSNATEYIYF